MIGLALACLAWGDSIAVGTGRALAPCHVVARVGASSSAILRMAPPHGARVVVLSAGSNDPTNPRLSSNLERMRARVVGDVTWLVPRHPHAARVVLQVAARHGDRVVVLSSMRSNDGVHPKSYAAVARAVRAGTKTTTGRGGGDQGQIQGPL